LEAYSFEKVEKDLLLLTLIADGVAVLNLSAAMLYPIPPITLKG